MPDVLLIGGPKDGTILTLRRLETWPWLQFPVPPKLEIHNKPVDYTPMRIYVYKRIPGRLDYYFVGVK